MQLIIKNFTGNPAAFMRSKGYALGRRSFSEGGAEELSFVRRVTSQEFPRFHAYVRLEKAKEIASSSDGRSPRNDANESSRASAKQSQNLIVNLHLDQKKPTYKSMVGFDRRSFNVGGAAHAGEYDGELIKEELEKFKS